MTTSLDESAVLRTGSREPLANPTPEDVRYGLEELDGVDLPVLSLETSRGVVEVSIVAETGVIVGFLPAGGGLECSISSRVPLETALELLLRFMSGDESWRDLVDWRSAVWPDDDSPDLEKLATMVVDLRDQVDRAAGHLSERKQSWILRGLVRSRLRRMVERLERRGIREAGEVVYDLEVFLLQILRASSEGSITS